MPKRPIDPRLAAQPVHWPQSLVMGETVGAPLREAVGLMPGQMSGLMPQLSPAAPPPAPAADTRLRHIRTMPPAPEPLSKPRQAKPKPDLLWKNRVCLIVDDVEFDRSRMRRTIAKFCPEVPMLVAMNLQQTRQRLRDKDREVAIVFLDNVLPDGTGVDFVGELAEDPVLKRIPIILVSDFPTPFMYAKARAANVREVWSKTEFNGNKVRDAIQKYVGSE